MFYVKKHPWRSIMNKIEINNNTCLYPIPMVLVGAVVEGKANFMACAWVTRANYKPPMIGITIGPHYTNRGIEENKVFSINIPDKTMINAVDYCGLATGKNTDKSQIFKVFYGELKHAPMIEKCPVTMECKLFKSVKLPYNTLYIGEIIKAYSEEQYLTDGTPDIKKIKPFSLTMPDNNYWLVGEAAGKAWSIGKQYESGS
jgi:flavin reductase (DIM6/NTAB) family NADH-FMN oxidoreductase RutF